MADKIALYASVGPALTHFDLDVDAATLARRGTVTLPANVHYVWPHASRRFLYAATSDSASGVGGFVGNTHHVSAFRIDPDTGALAAHGAPVPLPTRPIHMTTDIPSEHILVAFSNPSGLRVYRINPDGSAGAEVPQGPIDPGIYGHQVRVSPDNRRVILVTRGHDAAGGRPEEPGALKVFDYAGGVLANEVSVAPGGGYGFGPRHLDFHPTRPWVYVSLERQNRLDMFDFGGGRLSAEAVFRTGTLGDPGRKGGRQVAGTVHVHPNGRFVYVANRASSTVEDNGWAVFAGGENTLAVFAIDPATGAPTPIQHEDTRGMHCRTFHIDPSGRLLVAAHIAAVPVRDDGGTRLVPACLSLFRIGEDGRLTFVRKYDVDVGAHTMWWMGMVDLPD
ncbi:MAG TPA: beta-propeller fold lactonase family protein [Stellaceae bacterium]|jgi:6-phosphogluconolactonase (cycloisomerase 2 family)|nr:beta-propeller fold lactonase family protein [Stellaceae bacterium]